MTAEVRRSLLLAAVGLLGGFAMVVALFGTGELLKRNATVTPSAETPAAPETPGGPETGDRAGAAPSTGSPHAALPAVPQGESAAAGPSAPEPDGRPSFDIVRVEPDGASVVAGRAAPNARIELLRDGRPFASATADAAGQFALTPPDLPAGSSEIALRATAADGTPLAGRESVTVVVAESRRTKPLIALSAPDRPTQVLSQPDATEAQAATTKPPADPPGKAAPAEAGSAGTARIVSVDAQEGGRLDVTGRAASGSAVRLYLNDTLVAAGQAAADGRVAFTIGRGVKPGAYRIRIDTVDPAGGRVRSRAEVAFAYPDNPPPTRFAGVGPSSPDERPPVSVPKRPAAAMPGERPATAPSRPAQEPAQEPAQGTARATAREKAPPAALPSLAAPAGPAKSAGAEPGRPAVPGTPSIAASSGMAAPSPERDGRAAALAPGLPGTAPAPGGQNRVAATESGVAAPAGEAGSVFVPEISTARITRGDSLWQISRRTYGHGHRYTVIYDANQGQIRNPDLIYPGQMFVLPRDEPTPGGPSAKSSPDRRT